MGDDHQEDEIMDSERLERRSGALHASPYSGYGGAAAPVHMPSEPISSPSYPAASSTANTTLHLGGQLLGSMPRDQLRFCTSVVRNLKRNKKAVPFLEPVDPIKLNIPNYHTIITRPMDLGTVEKLLANNAYADADAFSSDVHQIFQNCYLYNGRDSPYSAMAGSLEKSFETQMKRLPVASGVMAHQSLALARGCSAGPTAGQSYFSRVPAVPAGQHRAASVRTSKFSSSPRSPSSTVGSTNIDRRLTFCSSVLSELLKKTHAAYSYPFLQPVDPVALGIPDYPLIIQRPMDISTIRQKYNAGQYASHVEFEEDIKLMFNNCFTYNKTDDPVYVMGKQLEQVFLNKWKDLPPPPVKKKAALAKTPLKTASKPGTVRKKSAALEPTEIEEDKSEKSSESESEDAGSSVFGKNLEQIALMEAHMSVLQKRLVEMKEAATTAKAKKKKKSKTGIAQQPAASANSKSTKGKKSKGESSNKAQGGGGSRGNRKSSNTVEAGGASLPPDEAGAVSAVTAPAHKTRKRRASEVDFFSTERHGGDHDRSVKGGQGDDGAAAEADGSRRKSAKKAKAEPSVVHFEHKQELSELINELSEDKLETVIEIIHESMPHLREAGTDEVELDIDALDYRTFYNLYNFVVKGARSMRSVSGDDASGGDGGAGGRQPQSSLMTRNATGARAKPEFFAEASSGIFCDDDVNTGMQENKDYLDSEMKRIASQEKLKQVTDVPGGGGAVGAAPRVSHSDFGLRQRASRDRGGDSAGETSDESLT